MCGIDASGPTRVTCPTTSSTSPDQGCAHTRGPPRSGDRSGSRRDGYRATSVTDIARDANLSSTAAYVYFPNKEALFIAAVDEDAAGVVNAASA